MRTNFEVEIWQQTVAWDKSRTEALLDYYDAWVDFDQQWTFMKGVAALIGKGVVIMAEEVDLKDCFLIIDEQRYEIAQIGKFYDRKKEFHHMEIVFK